MNSKSRVFLASLVTAFTLLSCQTASAQEILAVTNSPSSKHVKSGKKFAYLVSVTNSSQTAIESVRVCNELPTGVQFEKASAKVQFEDAFACIIWDSLLPGQSHTVKITVRVDRNAQSGLAVSKASASAGELVSTTFSRVRIRAGATVKAAAPVIG